MAPLAWGLAYSGRQGEGASADVPWRHSRASNFGINYIGHLRTAAKTWQSGDIYHAFNNLHQNRHPSQNFKEHLLYCFNLKGQPERAGKPGKMG